MAAVKLIFSQQPVPTPGPVRLVFGDDDAPPAIPDVTLHGGGHITGLRLHIGLRAGVRVVGGGRITGMRLHIATKYDINVARPTVGGTHTRWQDAAPLSHASRSTWQQSVPLPAGTRSHWQDASALAASLHVRWEDSQQLQRAVRIAFEQAAQLPTAPTRSGFQEAERVQTSAATGFQEAIRLPVAPLRVRYEETLRDRQVCAGARFEVADMLAAAVASGMGIAVQLPRSWDGRFQQAWTPRPGQWQGPVPPKPDEPCYQPALPARLVFADPFDASLPARLVFVCERHGPGPGPEPEAHVVVPIRRVYIVLNNITLHRVDTGAELRAHSFGMSLDHQSWTWSWNASLHHDAAHHLGRESNGDPAEIAVEVNGMAFRLRLERLVRDRRFLPEQRWAVSGKGKAAILASPWAPTLSFGNPTAARTAQQLALDSLTINGVGIGWGIDWQLQDWQVPAGAWAMQGSYIDAINDIAAAAGGYVQPHSTEPILRILPRYPAAPWAWNNIAPDFEIPADAAEIEGTEFVDKPNYNRVFLGGVGVGVFGPFTRAGTAGIVIAPQVSHALITDATAHRQRGIAELSDTGRQELVTLTMQVLPETGVIVPGTFIRYRGEKTVIGIVRGTSINWSSPKLRQSLEIETHA
ncbi:MAG: hypothetical protein RR715_00075 [Comamonas sp.]